jgi:hypothetical protein
MHVRLIANTFILCKHLAYQYLVYYFRTINAGKSYLVNEDQASAEMFCLHVINVDNEPDKEDTIVCFCFYFGL